MCTRYSIINRLSELKVHIELTRFVQPEKIEIDANERAVNEKSPYCFFVCTTFDSFLNDFLNSPNLNFINSRIKNSIYVYCPVNYFKFLTKNTCLSIEFKLCFYKFFCKEIFMNISPVRKTSVSFPFLVSVFL